MVTSSGLKCEFRGVARIFQRGVTEATHQIVMSTSTPCMFYLMLQFWDEQTIYGLYRCSPSCISGFSRIIAA